MNQLPILFFISVFLCSCSQDRNGHDSNSDKPGRTFSLHGTIAEGSNKSLYFEEWSMGRNIPKDTIIINKEGEFFINLGFNENAFHRIKNDSGKYFFLVPEVNDTILFTANFHEMQPCFLSGNPGNKVIAQLRNESISFINKISEIALITRDSMHSPEYPKIKAKLHLEYDSLFNGFKNYSHEIIRNHSSYPYVFLALYNKPGDGITVFSIQHDFEVFAMIDSSLYNLYPDFPEVKELHDKLNIIKMQNSLKKGQK